MLDKPISPLRQRMIDDMTARRFNEHTQRDYVRNVRMFAAFLGRSPDTATKEDLRRFQLHMAKQQMSAGSINAAIAALRFFFTVTLERPDLVLPLTTVNKLPVDEFIRRFLMHVLPNGFHRIRHYGLFASPRRAANIAHLRELLANADDASQPFGDAGMGVADAASADLADAFAIAQICPCCGGRMSVVKTFARGAQPPSFKADAARIDTS
jgi:integrase-like protein/putative transposase